MGDSLDQRRPAKRIRLAPPLLPSNPISHSQARPHRQRPIRPAPGNTPELEAAPAFHILDTNTKARRVRRPVRSRGGRAASGTDTSRPSSQMPVDAGSSPASTESTSSLISTPTPPSPPQEQVQMATIAVDTPRELSAVPPDVIVPPRVEIDLTLSDSDTLSISISSGQGKSCSPQDLFVSATSCDQVLPSQEEQEHDDASAQPKHGFVSAFKGCFARFRGHQSQKFTRPKDGRLNSYVKFHWPVRTAHGGRSSSLSIVNDDDGHIEEITRPSTGSSGILINANRHTDHHSNQPSPHSTAMLLEFKRRLGRSQSLSGVSRSLSGASPEAPQMLPPHFGLDSRMDNIDSRLWTFYIRNWCPGRSILGKTNSWLQDFAPMEGSSGVLHAMQSLAGVYIYDYLPLEEIRQRINLRFAMAEARLSHLLAQVELTVTETSELITIISILSMLDIVHTEGRRKHPHTPRWLEGFKQCEYFLESLDEGSRFWSTPNIQLSSLRISQSIIVGRAVILSQLMAPLTDPRTFDAMKESQRFSWLLYGNFEDMYEIHGGCGFSKKLLYSMSQISFCAGRLYQDPESHTATFLPQFLLRELQGMRQWSSAPEALQWEEAKTRPPVIEMVRATPDGYVIDNACHMTEVTAEAWRIAAIIYLYCRAWRIPRNHHVVLNNLDDLAKCIRIMPTSGYIFTAQAPLFPVFLLGMLATVPEHAAVAQTWFESVTSTPVRSSVPPLYDALKSIWTWIDTEPSLRPPVKPYLDEDVGKRFPWWEHLVKKVQETETETLCLT